MFIYTIFLMITQPTPFAFPTYPSLPSIRHAVWDQLQAIDSIVYYYNQLHEATSRDPFLAKGILATQQLTWLQPIYTLCKDVSTEPNVDSFTWFRAVFLNPLVSRSEIASLIRSIRSSSLDTVMEYEVDIAKFIMESMLPTALSLMTKFDLFRDQFLAWRQYGLFYAYMLIGKYSNIEQDFHLAPCLDVELVQKFLTLCKHPNRHNLLHFTREWNIECLKETPHPAMHALFLGLDELAIALRIKSDCPTRSNLDTALSRFPILTMPRAQIAYRMWYLYAFYFPEYLPPSYFYHLRSMGYNQVGMTCTSQGGSFFKVKNPLETGKSRVLYYNIENHISDLLDKLGSILHSPNLVTAIMSPRRSLKSITEKDVHLACNPESIDEHVREYLQQVPPNNRTFHVLPLDPDFQTYWQTIKRYQPKVIKNGATRIMAATLLFPLEKQQSFTGLFQIHEDQDIRPTLRQWGEKISKKYRDLAWPLLDHDPPQEAMRLCKIGQSTLFWTEELVENKQTRCAFMAKEQENSFNRIFRDSVMTQDSNQVAVVLKVHVLHAECLYHTCFPWIHSKYDKLHVTKWVQCIANYPLTNITMRGDSFGEIVSKYFEYGKPNADLHVSQTENVATFFYTENAKMFMLMLREIV